MRIQFRITLVTLPLILVSSFLTPSRVRSILPTIPKAFEYKNIIALFDGNSPEDFIDDDETVVYTTKQLMKEETEAPFRKVRFFIYGSLLVAAGLGSLMSLTQVIAASSGFKKDGFDDVLINLAVNVGGIPVLAYLWKRDVDSQESKLQRIQKGGSLAGLKARIGTKDAPLVVKLSDLRRDRGIEKRVVIVAAPRESLESSIISSIKQSENLMANDLLIIPLQLNVDSTLQSSFSIEMPSLESMLGEVALENRLHIGVPVGLPSWQNVIKREIKDAIKQDKSVLTKGITIVIKKNGKVGSRRFGVPIWEVLVDDVEMRRETGLDVTNI